MDCIIQNSLDQVKSYIDKIRNECYKAKRHDKDIQIAAILYPDVIDSSYTDNKERDEKEPKHRRLLSGSIDQIGKYLHEIKNRS